MEASEMSTMALQLPTFDFQRAINFGYRSGILALCFVLCIGVIGCSTTWIVDLENYLPVAVAAVAGLMTILVSAGALGPILPAEIAAVSTAVTAGLTLLCGVPVNNQCNPASLVGTWNANPTNTILQKIQAEMATLQSNLQSFLALVHIKNSVIGAAFSAGLSLVLSIIGSIIARVKPVAVAMISSGRKAALKAMQKSPQMPMSANQFKAQFNRIVADGGYPGAAIQ
jgi:hypothetical protein